MEAMAAKIKTYQKINDLLTNSDMPLLILYDLHLWCDAGEANIDFAVLTNRFITTISCPSQEDELAGQVPYTPAAFGEQVLEAANEHSAYILTEILRTERLVNKKNLQIVRPITISPVSLQSPEYMESSAKGIPANAKKSVSSLFSQTYPKIHRNIFVEPANFLAQIKQLFQMENDFSWLTNHELFAISDTLLKYDEMSACSNDGQKE